MKVENTNECKSDETSNEKKRLRDHENFNINKKQKINMDDLVSKYSIESKLIGEAWFSFPNLNGNALFLLDMFMMVKTIS